MPVHEPSHQEPTDQEPRHQESSDFHIAVVDLPAADQPLGVIDRLLREGVALDNRVWREVFGHDDFDSVETSSIEFLQHQENARKRHLLALTGAPFASRLEHGLPLIQPDDDPGTAQVIGSVQLAQSKHDNQHMIDSLEIGVHPDFRRRGVASALLTATETVARAWGVTTLIGWGTHANGADHPAALKPKEGDFAIAPDAASAFAMAKGFTLGQCERHSVQAVHQTEVEVSSVPGGYELVQWSDACPDELRDAKARLNMAMAADVPRGELDLEDEVWDAERVASSEAYRYRDHQGLTTAVRHLATGELAGFTNLRRRPELPRVGWQDVTVVVKDHRGHGLGRLLKEANLGWLKQVWPEVERVHTWNAGENQWMLAINDHLGYRVATVGGAWQKKLLQSHWPHVCDTDARSSADDAQRTCPPADPSDTCSRADSCPPPTSAPATTA